MEAEIHPGPGARAKVVQIQAVVEGSSSVLYALLADGRIFHKRMSDSPESEWLEIEPPPGSRFVS